MTKRKAWIAAAIALTLCMVCMIGLFAGCGGSSDDDKKDDDVATEDEYEYDGLSCGMNAFVTVVVGKEISTNNLNDVILYKGSKELMIGGMAADQDAKDTVMFVDENGNEVDSIRITSGSQYVTVRYTGSKYTVKDRDYQMLVTAYYGEYGELLPATVTANMNDVTIDDKAKVGDGADAFTLLTYYYDTQKASSQMDSKAEFTITINGSADGVLQVGENVIEGVSECIMENGEYVSATLVIYFAEGDDTIYTDAACTTAFDWSAWE